MAYPPGKMHMEHSIAKSSPKTEGFTTRGQSTKLHEGCVSQRRAWHLPPGTTQEAPSLETQRARRAFCCSVNLGLINSPYQSIPPGSLKIGPK